MNDDPLAELLLDAAEIDRTRLASALKKILGIDNKTGKVILKPGFNKLSAKQKVLAFLLGRKVSNLLEKIETESVSAKEIPGESGVPKGTVHPKLRELIEARIISQSEEGEYYVESHQILQALEQLKQEDKNGPS